MPLVKVKPTSPGRRALVKVVTPELHKGDPHWPLTESKIRGSGRNNHGRITMRHQGGGHKHHLRIIDFRPFGGCRRSGPGARRLLRPAAAALG
jgi:large subunit ribosomal protein L2